jgi:hypothetical protein
MEDSLFAYSLSQCEQGWVWRLWNETGDVVAAGDAPDQVSAHDRLLEAFEIARHAAGEAPEETRRADGVPPAGRPARARRAGRRSGTVGARDRRTGELTFA